MKYDVLIPAYNAESTIKELLDKIGKLDKIPDKIIVIDDGSEDNTAGIASEMNATVIKIDKNCGKGLALKKGFHYFISNSDCDYLLCIDADLQHPVSSIPKFLQYAKKNKSQLLIGNRRKSFRIMPAHRIFSNIVTSFIISILIKQKIKDSQCGFRMIHRDLLKKLNMSKNDFLIESEMIFEAAGNNIDIHFIDIPTIYSYEQSHINNIDVSIKFIVLIFKEVKKIIFNKLFLK